MALPSGIFFIFACFSSTLISQSLKGGDMENFIMIFLLPMVSLSNAET